MNVSSKKINTFFLSTLLLAFFVINCGPGSPRLVQKKYPEGFSLKHPENWQVQIVEKTYICASAKEEGEDSSFVLIYPFFLKKKTQSLTWLQENIPNLSKFFTDAHFEKTQHIRTQPDEALVKMKFQKGNASCSGTALCSIYGKSGILFVMGAREEDFEAKRNQLVATLQSFKFEEHEKGKSQISPQPQYTYKTWQDPIERAFSLEVPKGWTVKGGTFRRAAVDLVHFLHATSPDQTISIQLNDRNIPVFTTPSPILSMAGFYEGSWYSPGYGVRMLVQRYTPSYSFLKGYLQSHYIPHLRNFEFVSQQDRSDVVNAFNKIYSQFMTMGISFTLHAGEVAFKYEQNAKPFVGYGLSMTQIVQSSAMQGGQWSVPLMVIYTCPASEAETVYQVFVHMFNSIRPNPQWVASQQQLAVNVSQIVTQTSQEISRIINESYWSRQRTMDDIHRKFSNYILGVTDLVDPTTGEKWKVEYGHNYYWRKDATDLIGGTEVYERPDIDFSPLKEF